MVWLIRRRLETKARAAEVIQVHGREHTVNIKNHLIIRSIFDGGENGRWIVFIDFDILVNKK